MVNNQIPTNFIAENILIKYLIMKSIIYSRFQLHPFVYIGTDGGPESYSSVNIHTRVQRVCFGQKLSGTNVVNDK